MKFTIDQNELSKCVNIVQKGISSKTTLPILNGILIYAKNDKLTLTGTDLEIGIETSIDCNIEEEGSIVITSRIFGDIIRKLPNLPINIEVDEKNNVHITCGLSKFNIVGQPSLEYPQLPQIDNKNSFEVPKDLLKNMIRQTIFATAQDETRPILTGALLEINNENAALVALDGYRLALKNASVNYKEEIKVVIPSKTLNEVNKILDDDDSDIEISCTDNHIIFNLGNTVITSRLLEGQFLNYKDIIRNEYKSRVKVKTKSIQESIERASLLAREGKNNLVKFDVSDDKLVITSNSEIGDVYEEIPIELEGNVIQIAFNSKYILDGIRVIDSEEIILNLVSNVNPCIIKPVEDESYTYLILPVRLA
ncbi:DNA polymerase III subunit beta [Gottschalkia purinilytica]|uniref:Beta sliding clamp n=1 Tax=Gottschalkia purinilytica TaxID=1503 RepID=A0A0L0W708_GOTPU|nr:DNA polymerase III subunit beta [Gottschalkia purinilytica]KNF07299.1 DNA polymerase III subunit beta [Gottschalkia purinilytica]